MSHRDTKGPASPAASVPPGGSVDPEKLQRRLASRMLALAKQLIEDHSTKVTEVTPEHWEQVDRAREGQVDVFGGSPRVSCCGRGGSHV